MYICNSCGKVFEDYKVIFEPHPFGMGTVTEEWCVCPCCGDADFTEANECERCGEYFADLTEGLCDCCYGEMYE